MVDKDLANVLTQYYRGEISRANTWRTRMDRTINWSVVITAAVTTWVFSNPNRNHIVLLLGYSLITIFLFMEARRYRFYDLWRARVRVLEEYFFCRYITDDVSKPKNIDWKKMIAEDLKNPRFKITFFEAVARRLKRIYLWIILVIYAAWILKLIIHPEITNSLIEAIYRAKISFLPGELVFSLTTIVTALLIIITLFEVKSNYMERRAKGEIKEQKEEVSQRWKD